MLRGSILKVRGLRRSTEGQEPRSTGREEPRSTGKKNQEVRFSAREPRLEHLGDCQPARLILAVQGFLNRLTQIVIAELLTRPRMGTHHDWPRPPILDECLHMSMTK